MVWFMSCRSCAVARFPEEQRQSAGRNRREDIDGEGSKLEAGVEGQANMADGHAEPGEESDGRGPSSAIPNSVVSTSAPAM